MKKSTKNLFLGGAIAVAVFYLFKNVLGQKEETTLADAFTPEAPGTTQAALSGEFQRATASAVQKQKVSQKEASDLETSFKRILAGIASPAEGVSFINKAVGSGVKLPRTSRTLSDFMTVTQKSTGRTLRGRVVQLGTGTKKFISVSSKG
jgi:hypothetical protein